jgi:hypothetical protein
MSLQLSPVMAICVQVRPFHLGSDFFFFFFIALLIIYNIHRFRVLSKGFVGD